MRPMRAWSPFLLILLAATPAGAQQIVTSARPDRVAVTVYRSPNRAAGEAMNPEWLNGYALVSETRQITIPAGEADIRFEGVAGGILPQSAIVTGLPDGMVERNRDALLLSPESLLDRSLGRRVGLRRTSAIGAVTREDAIIRTGADGAVVLQTAAGFEALRCTGLPETLVYDGVPQGLSARPTLSVRTRSSRPVTATVTLSYLASGFDWQANYVARLSADGAHVDLFAWLVLASNDETSFADAQTQAVAGRLHREPVESEEPERNPIALRCWPQGTTSDIPLGELAERGMIGGLARERTLVLVNGRRAVPGSALDELPQLRASFAQAQLEALGDLKLYRIPDTVTVAAHSIKQVAFLERTQVPVRFVYRQHLYRQWMSNPVHPTRLMLTRNRIEDALGLPLPGGRIQLFAAQDGRAILTGEGSVRDHAVNEDVEIELNETPGVTSVVSGAGKDPQGDLILTVSNDRNVPVQYEALFEMPAQQVLTPAVRLGRRDGKALWAVTIPAHGSVTLRYRMAGRGES